MSITVANATLCPMAGLLTHPQCIQYTIMDKNQQTVPLARLDKVKDTGVYFDAKLYFKDHMHEKINKAYMMLGLINRNFKHMSIPTFVALYKSMVRSHFKDYFCPVWSPYRKGDIEALEKVQKRTTKLIPVLKNLPYKNRLKACNMSTLHYRQVEEI